MRAPAAHRRLIGETLPKISEDKRITGVALSGSLASGQSDDYSDVDLILVVEDAAFEEVMGERLALIESWTPLVAGVTGEHVGEPRLIITLVGPPLLHVDFKFVRSCDFGARTEDLEILWDRDGALARALAASTPASDSLDLPWIEDRFWIWIHYGATKVARGELFQVIGFLAYLRDTVLGPLAAVRAGNAPRGVRRIEDVD
ncbi:MAG: nucleotidyltransferase domain-containing protein, partial [Stackebrandtia sp.]